LIGIHARGRSGGEFVKLKINWPIDSENVDESLVNCTNKKNF
jgi:hypothetical protein